MPRKRHPGADAPARTHPPLNADGNAAARTGVTIYGLDFTSAPSRNKPLTCAVAAIDGPILRITELRRLDGFRGFEALLDSPGPWVLGADFPFSQPRRLIEYLDWPRTWEACVRHVHAMGKREFEAQLLAYTHGRPPGDIHHKRHTDRLANAQSPMKLHFIPTAKMYFQGAPRLAQSSANIPPCRPTTDNRTILEVYPALIARRAAPKTPYKEGHTPAEIQHRAQTRAHILQWLTTQHAQQTYGFTTTIHPTIQNAIREDTKGDLLDSILCALQTAWAANQHHPNYAIPPTADPLEGWITDPSLR